IVLPAAYSSASISTVIRVPLIIGFPPAIPGLVVIKGCFICQPLSNAQTYLLLNVHLQTFCQCFAMAGKTFLPYNQAIRRRRRTLSESRTVKAPIKAFP